jgi:hypothetical protein
VIDPADFAGAPLTKLPYSSRPCDHRIDGSVQRPAGRYGYWRDSSRNRCRRDYCSRGLKSRSYSPRCRHCCVRPAPFHDAGIAVYAPPDSTTPASMFPPRYIHESRVDARVPGRDPARTLM